MSEQGIPGIYIDEGFIPKKAKTVEQPVKQVTIDELKSVVRELLAEREALIAEIDGLERIDFDEDGYYYPCSDGDNYRFDNIRAVLSKYRRTK